MKIGMLGTGVVGQTLGKRLVALGHDVTMGSRSSGNEKAVAWAQAVGKNAATGTYADAAAFGELLFLATNGGGAFEALRAAGTANLNGKVLIDISNPLDTSKGFPPRLSVCNDESLAEQLQRGFPDLKIVKALNTVTASVMADPRQLNGGDHDLPLCGNDAGAKAQVTELLKTFGWQNFIDLGDITNARGMEAWLLLWIRLWGSFKTPVFNFKMVR